MRYPLSHDSYFWGAHFQRSNVYIIQTSASYICLTHWYITCGGHMILSGAMMTQNRVRFSVLNKHQFLLNT